MLLKPPLAAAAIAETVVHLGLPISGWDGWAFFAHPARVALGVLTVVLTGTSLFSRGIRRGRGDRWVLVTFGVIGRSRAAGRTHAVATWRPIRAEEALLRTGFGSEYEP